MKKVSRYFVEERARCGRADVRKLRTSPLAVAERRLMALEASGLLQASLCDAPVRPAPPWTEVPRLPSRPRSARQPDPCLVPARILRCVFRRFSPRLQYLQSLASPPHVEKRRQGHSLSAHGPVSARLECILCPPLP